MNAISGVEKGVKNKGFQDHVVGIQQDVPAIVEGVSITGYSERGEQLQTFS